MTSETQWIRDVPSDPMMANQWRRTAIPWCTTHDTKGDNDHLMFHRGRKICVISTGGPDHWWWKDV